MKLFFTLITTILLGVTASQVQAQGIEIEVPGASVNTSNGAATVQVDGIGTVHSDGRVDIDTPDVRVQTGVGGIGTDIATPEVKVQASGNVLKVRTAEGASVTLNDETGLGTLLDVAVVNAASIISLEGDESTYIKTEEDVATYNKIAVENTAQVTGVETSGEQVSVSYLHPGKLFGFIEVRMPARAEVNSEGSVFVQLPWYAFLTTHGAVDEDIKQQLETNTVNVSVGAEISPVTQVRMTQAVIQAITSNTEVAIQEGDVSVKAGGVSVDITDGNVKVEYK